MDLKLFGAEIVKACREFVEQRLGVLSKQLDALASRIDGLPMPKDGKDADPVLIKELVDAAVAAIPVPQDGKSVTVEEVAPLIAEQVSKAVAEIPVPQNGKDADPEVVADMVRTEVAKLPAPLDGKSVTAEDVAPIIKAEVDRAVAAIPPAAEPLDRASVVAEVLAAVPKPKDGESVSIERVQEMVEAAVARSFAVVRLPKDGEDGRDALDLDVLLSIDESRRYRRGAYASHNGGLWKAVRSTEGMDGWECVVEGLAHLSVEQHPENPRKFFVNIATSSGREQVKEFNLPIVLYRGIFKEGDAYETGDSVTWGGSTWIALQDTKSKPDSADGTWRLAVKKGAPGKDAK